MPIIPSISPSVCPTRQLGEQPTHDWRTSAAERSLSGPRCAARPPPSPSSEHCSEWHTAATAGRYTAPGHCGRTLSVRVAHSSDCRSLYCARSLWEDIIGQSGTQQRLQVVILRPVTGRTFSVRVAYSSDCRSLYCARSLWEDIIGQSGKEQRLQAVILRPITVEGHYRSERHTAATAGRYTAPGHCGRTLSVRAAHSSDCRSLYCARSLWEDIIAQWHTAATACRYTAPGHCGRTLSVRAAHSSDCRSLYCARSLREDVIGQSGIQQRLQVVILRPVTVGGHYRSERHTAATAGRYTAPGHCGRTLSLSGTQQRLHVVILRPVTAGGHYRSERHTAATAGRYTAPGHCGRTSSVRVAYSSDCRSLYCARSLWEDIIGQSGTQQRLQVVILRPVTVGGHYRSVAHSSDCRSLYCAGSLCEDIIGQSGTQQRLQVVILRPVTAGGRHRSERHRAATAGRYTAPDHCGHQQRRSRCQQPYTLPDS